MLLSITPTKLGIYLICPHQYQLRYIKKIDNFAPSAPLSFGRTMHNALQEVYESGKGLDNSAEIIELLKRHWEPDGYASSDESESYFLNGCQALERYCKTVDWSKERTIGTEVYLSHILKIDDLQVRLGCKADRVSICSDRILEVTDYKTNASGKIPTLDFLQNDLPTFLYYVLARIQYPEYKQVQITFVNILTSAKVSVSYDAAQIAINKEALLKCLKNISAGNFSPAPSEACSWCSVQNNCSAFSKVIDFASIS